MSANGVKVCVIGGGPAGMLCAGKAAELGCDVTLYEKNKALGRKLAITGKGRCNLTNNCDRNVFMENVPTNPRFLFGAYSAFSSEDTMAFFEGLGVKLKTERGNRVFPVSDRAYDIVDALRDYCKTNGVKIVYGSVDDILVNGDKVEGVVVNGKRCAFDKVAVCTGGRSYPLTGSTGDGYRFAESVGIKVTDIKPSLVPLTVKEKWVSSLMGLSLKNVRLTVWDKIRNKEIYSDFGEMLFTHFGISGPLVLSASCHMRPMEKDRYAVMIDLKPALDEKTLNNRLLSDFEKNKNKDYINSLSALLPQKLIPVFVELTGIDGNKKVNAITKEERGVILRQLKRLEFTISGFRPIEEAVITSGGIDVKELSPKTMESKLCKKLYFIGEVLDVDAYTGGFNLQIAWATGKAAGEAAAAELHPL